jgi:hypothetical protein
MSFSAGSIGTCSKSPHLSPCVPAQRLSSDSTASRPCYVTLPRNNILLAVDQWRFVKHCSLNFLSFLVELYIPNTWHGMHTFFGIHSIADSWYFCNSTGGRRTTYAKKDDGVVYWVLYACSTCFCKARTYLHKIKKLVVQLVSTYVPTVHTPHSRLVYLLYVRTYVLSRHACMHGSWIYIIWCEQQCARRKIFAVSRSNIN